MSLWDGNRKRERWKENERKRKKEKGRREREREREREGEREGERCWKYYQAPSPWRRCQSLRKIFPTESFNFIAAPTAGPGRDRATSSSFTMRARSQSYSDYGPATTAANMKQVSTLTIILVIYISSLQGTTTRLSLLECVLEIIVFLNDISRISMVN